MSYMVILNMERLALKSAYRFRIDFRPEIEKERFQFEINRNPILICQPFIYLVSTFHMSYYILPILSHMFVTVYAVYHLLHIAYCILGQII